MRVKPLQAKSYYMNPWGYPNSVEVLNVIWCFAIHQAQREMASY